MFIRCVFGCAGSVGWAAFTFLLACSAADDAPALSERSHPLRAPGYKPVPSFALIYALPHPMEGLATSIGHIVPCAGTFFGIPLKG